jgi:EAL domain-containing protein (putative c-di-GMP-specific phosphodiesterase class I)
MHTRWNFFHGVPVMKPQLYDKLNQQERLIAMVKSINEIGHVMGMQTIAEFVENDEIKWILKEIGVNYGQGYGLHKPQPFDELLKRNFK